jgi:Ca2+-transporting ATPase
MWTAIASRSTTHTMAEIGWFSNRRLLGAIALAIALMIPIIYVPFIQNIFGTDSLSLLDWAQVIVISIFGLIAVEVWENINRKYFHYGVTA